MKKIMILLLIILSYSLITRIFISYEVMPSDAIRIRVLANSNEKKDQEVKKKVEKKLEEYYYEKLKDVENVLDAKSVIIESLDDVDKIVKNTLQSDNYNVNFGNNYFPNKIYKGIKYDEGMYESLVITLGSGLGDNWWCVLFPPLCLIDEDKLDDIEYRSFVVDMINKYF